MSARFSFSYRSCCCLFLVIVASLFHLCQSNKSFDDDVLCLGIEKQALLQFKNGLIDEASRLASWDNGEERDCCKWVGIGCDNITGHVHHIHLPALNGHCESYDIDYNTDREYEEALKQRLRGNLSSSLLHLKQLSHLDLSCNDFEGRQVPKFIGSLINMRYLNLSISNFSGMIPPQLGNLSKLHVLCLGSYQSNGYESTRMSNMQWLSRLHLLQHLDLSRVDLSKSINWLQVINTIPSLVQLHLSYCQLSHIHSHVTGVNLTSLSLLDLSNNDFNSSFPQWIFSITSLVSLDLSFCYFHGPTPKNIGFRNLTSLESLHVSSNSFMNSSLVLRDLSSSIGGNLISLDIHLCRVSNSVLDSLHNLTSVRSLDLSDNQLTKAIPKSLGNLCNLRDLDLSHNDFGNISLTSLLVESVFMCKSPHLESLDLSWNFLSGPIPSSIGQLSLLKKLDLSFNQLNGGLPHSIGQLSSLQILDLYNNQLNGVVTEAHFSKLVNLKKLDGRGNKLTLRPTLANWIPPFQLENLNLNSWVLGPQFPLWLQSQKELLGLDISNTGISSLISHIYIYIYMRYLVNLRMKHDG